LARGEKATNQGHVFDTKTPLIVWNNLNFRSKAEKLIAEALDQVGVLYLPIVWLEWDHPNTVITKNRFPYLQ
jgi:hypothetical protein